MILFPDIPAREVLATTRAMWDLSGPLPVPKGEWLRCPVCGAAPQPRYWRLHHRPGATVPGRCDVSLKCTLCSHVWVHGVALDDDTYKRMTTRNPRRRVPWREARKLLEG